MTSPAQAKYIPWNTVEREKLNPLIDREMLTGQNLMLARVIMKKARMSRSITITMNK